MLAMMASVLSKCLIISNSSDPLQSPNRGRKEGISQSIYSSSIRSLPFQLTAQQRYFPSHEMALSLLNPSTSPWSARETATLNVDPPSVVSSFGASGSDPVIPFSSGITPPSTYMPARTSFKRLDLTSQILSTSPEQLRNPKRSNSNLGSGFTTSFPHQSGCSAPTSSSPPNPYLKRRDSPAGSYAGGAQPSVTWAAASLFGRSWSNIEEPKSTNTTFQSFKTHYRSNDNRQSMSVSLKNQDLFDDEGCSSIPLLDDSLKLRFQGYKDAYAHLLFIWDLPMARTEMLQHSSEPPTRKASFETASIQQGNSTISLGRKTSQVSAVTDGKAGLDILRTCLDCNEILPLATKTSRPKHQLCRSKAMSLCCSLCEKLIQGRATPCLGCGHILHAACMALLISKIEAGSQSTKCISGCQCQCRIDVVVPVSWPEERHTPASSAPTIREGEEGSGGVWEGQRSVWEDVAYESLAKNLGVAGEKYVKSKASKIWRGREKSANSMNI